jgi:hypothetical protein
MSGLAAIIAGRHEPGVFRWHAAFDRAEVAHAVEHAGWQFGYVDGWRCADKEAFLTALAEALGFPDEHRSLDDLTDDLTGLAEPTVLLWDGWSTLARTDDETFTRLCGIFAERAGGTPPFTTLMRGEGPDVDVPFLD